MQLTTKEVKENADTRMDGHNSLVDVENTQERLMKLEMISNEHNK